MLCILREAAFSSQKQYLCKFLITRLPHISSIAHISLFLYSFSSASALHAADSSKRFIHTHTPLCCAIYFLLPSILCTYIYVLSLNVKLGSCLRSFLTLNQKMSDRAMSPRSDVHLSDSSWPLLACGHHNTLSNTG